MNASHKAAIQYALFFVVIGLTIVIQSTTNRLRITESAVNDAWSRLLSQYEQRYTLLPGVLNTAGTHGLVSKQQAYSLRQDIQTFGQSQLSRQEQVKTIQHIELALSRLQKSWRNAYPLPADLLRFTEQLDQSWLRIAIEYSEYQTQTDYLHQLANTLPYMWFAKRANVSTWPSYE